jgi:hypothetical protein
MMLSHSKKGTAKPWSDRRTLSAQLHKLWDRGVVLRELICPTDLFPKRLVFKSPNAGQLASEFDHVRNWVSEIQALSGFRIEYKTVRNRVIGENSLPAEAWVDNFDSVVALINKQKECDAFSEMVAHTKQNSPQLMTWIHQYPLKALSLMDVWPKLLSIVRWRQQHPSPRIYLRQLNLPGIDTKFFEKHLSVLAQLLDLSLPEEQINAEWVGSKHFAERYGFCAKPKRIRFRLLDPTLSLLPGTDSDLSVTAGDFACISQVAGFSDSIHRIFITENEINFLAFPPQNNSLIIFGAGYGFEALAQAQWLSGLSIVYWGDIDTHGFAILHQLRCKFRHTQSLLMDEKTLLDHREFWGTEDKQQERELSRLTDSEQNVYQTLLSNQLQENLRLEQERIHFEYLQTALAELASR